MSAVRRARLAFTLVELLVVIAIIGVLVALLLPAVLSAREAARRTQCANNLKQMGIALHNYADTFGVFPFGWSDRGAGWTTMVLPYIEQKNLWDTLKFNEADNWDSAGSANQAACGTYIQTFRCPSMGVVPKHVDNQSIPGRVQLPIAASPPPRPIPTTQAPRPRVARWKSSTWKASSFAAVESVSPRSATALQTRS